MELVLTQQAVLTVLRLIKPNWGDRATVVALVAEEAAQRPPDDQWVALPRAMLMEACGLAEHTAFRILRDLHGEKVVEKRPGRGSAANEYRLQPDVSRWEGVPWRIDQAAACYQIALALARVSIAQQTGQAEIHRAPHTTRDGDFPSREKGPFSRDGLDLSRVPSTTRDGGWWWIPSDRALDDGKLNLSREKGPFSYNGQDPIARGTGSRDKPGPSRDPRGTHTSFFDVVTSLSEREEQNQRQKQRLLVAIARATNGGELFGGPLRDLERLIEGDLDVDDALTFIQSRAWGRSGPLAVLSALQRRGVDLADEARRQAERHAAEEAAAQARRDELAAAVRPPVDLRTFLHPVGQNGAGRHDQVKGWTNGSPWPA